MYKMIGRIYKIEVNENDFYIGSTTTTLKERELKHNNALRDNVKYKYKLYEECRKNNITKISCLLLQEQEIEDIKEIRQLEEEYIEKLNPTLNSHSAYTGLTKEEYRKKYNKEYRQKNKEYFREYKQKNKGYNKEYYDKNKEYRQEYYNENKDKVLERQGEKIKCPICNNIIRRDTLSKHKKTIKCRKSVECFIQDK